MLQAAKRFEACRVLLALLRGAYEEVCDVALAALIGRLNMGETPLASDNSSAVALSAGTSASMRSSVNRDIGPAMIRIARTSPVDASTGVAIELMAGKNMSCVVA